VTFGFAVSPLLSSLERWRNFNLFKDISYSLTSNRLLLKASHFRKKINGKLEAKDILPNINRTQAAARVENAVFCPW